MGFLIDKAFLLFPLLAAALYATSAIALKASSNMGVGSRMTIVICNWFTAVGFLVFVDWANLSQLPKPWWPILAMGALSVMGQIFTVLALSHGEISSVTPVFGVKVIMVGFYVMTFIGTPVGMWTWIAAVLAVVGITCLQVSDSPHGRRKNYSAMLLAFCAASSYAAFDTMNQYWSPILGFGSFVPPAMFVAAILSFVLLIGRGGEGGGKVNGQAKPVSRRAIVDLLIGTALFALQSVVLIRSIGVFGNAASANVVYGSRGLWGIALVWIIGGWFGNHELKKRPARVIVIRLIGAAVMLAAMILVFLQPKP